MHVYTSVDIGTDTIKIAVCELFNNRLNLLAATSTKSKGIKKGLVTDVELATSSLKEAFSEIEKMLGINIRRVIVSVPSYFTEYIITKASIKVERENMVVTSQDINNVLDLAMKEKSMSTKELVSIIPIDYTLDDKTGIINPKGLVGENLSMRGVCAFTPKKNIYSVINLFSTLGIDVIDISLNSIGNISTFKNKNINDKVGAIIDIGHEITDISLFNKGIAVKTSIIPYGGKNITNDISYMYKIDYNTALTLKEKFALAYKTHASKSDFYSVIDENGDTLKVNQYEISEVASSRIEEILNLVKNELNHLTNKPIEYIIITGGTSMMPHFNYIADEVLGKKTTLGEVKLLGVRSNKYSACVGNIIYFINKLKLRDQNYSMMSMSDAEKITTVRKDFLGFSSDSMIGKVFGFFFGE